MTTDEAPQAGPSEAIRLIEMVFPDSTNHYGTMFGGKVLDLMDRAAFVAASRFTQLAMVTASTERVDFHVPIKVGQMVELEARVVLSGRTSVSVKVTLFAQHPAGGPRVHATTGYFHMVAVDPQGRPVPVPAFTPATEAERTDWKFAEALRRARLQSPRPSLGATA
jgi:acyl-CoA hydrolase